MDNQRSEPHDTRFTFLRPTSRIYAFVVVSLTIFLVGLVLWPAPQRGHRVLAKLEVTLDQLPLDEQEFVAWIDQVRDELISSSSSSNDLVPVEPSQPDPFTEYLQRKLKVSVVEGNRASTRTVEIELVGQGTEQELQRLNLLVTQLASRIQQRMQTSLDIADLGAFHEQFKDQLNQQQRVQTDLAIQLNRHFQQLKLWKEANHQNLQANQTATSPGSQVNTTPRQNSQLTQYASSIQNESPTQRPTQGSNSDSPLIRRNQFYPSATHSTASNTANSVPGRPTFDPEIVSQAERAITETQQRIAHEFVKQTNLADDFGQEIASAFPDQPMEGVQVLQTAKVVDRIGGSHSMDRVMAQGFLAMFIGGIFAWRCRLVPSQNVWNRVEEVKNAIALPVVGCLESTSADAAIPANPSKGKLTRSILYVCEMILVVIVAGFLLIAFWESEVMAELTRNPFDAISFAARTVLGN